MARIFFAVLIAGNLLSCAAIAAEPPGSGNWYGVGQPGDETEAWLAHHEANGNFTLAARVCHKGVAFDSIDHGTWTYRGGVQEIVTLSVDGEPTHFVDKYRTVTLDARAWSYRYIESNAAPRPLGYVFRAVRVAGDFQLPPCGPKIS